MRLEADNSKLEQSLEEAEEKIAGLLQVKEKLVNVQVSGIPVIATSGPKVLNFSQLRNILFRRRRRGWRET